MDLGAPLQQNRRANPANPPRLRRVSGNVRLKNSQRFCNPTCEGSPSGTLANCVACWADKIYALQPEDELQNSYQWGIMSNSEREQNLLAMKAAEAQAAAASLAKVAQTHADLLAAAKKDGSLAASSDWPAVWAGAIASGFGHYAFSSNWTGGAPHPWWTAGAHPTGGDWTAWATGTWAGAGQFYEDPKTYYGRQVWANLSCGGFGPGGASLSLYKSEGGPLIGKFGAYFSGAGGCNISCPMTYTSGP